MKVSLTTTLHPTNYTKNFFIAPIGDYRPFIQIHTKIVFRLHTQIKMSQDILDINLIFSIFLFDLYDIYMFEKVGHYI